MIALLLLSLWTSSLSGHPVSGDQACPTLTSFQKSLNDAVNQESSGESPLCEGSRPMAECTTAFLEILKTCIDGIKVDAVCLKNVHQDLSGDKACFCGGLVKFSQMLTVVEALQCPKDQGRLSRLFFQDLSMTETTTTTATTTEATYVSVSVDTATREPRLFFAEKFETSTCTTRTTAASTSTSCKCGVPAANRDRIVGGQAAEKNEYPWQVALIEIGSSTPFCGGTIISDDTILTAAHCARARPLNIRVVVAEHDYTDSTDGQVSITPCSWLSHPNYDSDTWNNDFAIIKLAATLTFSSTVMPACLPDPATDYDNVTAVVTGWGDTSFDGSQSIVLLEAEVSTRTNAACTTGTTYSPGLITDNMICAAGDGGKSVCQGDSGGPLITLENNLYYSLIGVVSWLRGCGREDSPSVFSRVTSQLSWITTNMSGNTCAKPTS